MSGKTVRSLSLRLALGLLCFSLLTATPLRAEPQRRATGAALSYTPVIQLNTDLDAGGAFRVIRHIVRADINRPIGKRTRIGFGLHYDFEAWRFGNTTSPPLSWQEVHRPNLSVGLFHATQDWRLMFIPSIGLAGSTSSYRGNCIVYGAVTSATRTFGKNLGLGFGAGLYSQLEQTTLFPLAVIDWRITETLRLKNPLEAGPAGPAGLELEYRPGQRWTIAAGGAYRSVRFRLDDTATLPNGIADDRFIAGFVRLTRKVNDLIRLDLAAGGLFAGKIELADAAGNSLFTTHYDTAPFISMSMSGRF